MMKWRKTISRKKGSVMGKNLKWFLLGAVLVNLACAPQQGVTGTSEGKIGDRRYVLVDPSNVSGKAPLVLALHGGFGDADYFQRALPLSQQASAQGFRVVYLEGVGTGPRNNRARSWNAGACCGPAQKKRVDDVGYINAVIGQLQKKGLVSNIHFVGHSNGGMMIYRYLCEGSKQVTSAVILSGSKMVSRCSVAGRPRVTIVHGDRDQNVPVNGGKGKGPSGANYASLSSSAQGLSGSGASVKQVLLPSTGHKMKEINDGLRKSSGQGVSNFVTRALFGG